MPNEITTTPGGSQMDINIDAPIAPAASVPTEFSGLVPEGFADKQWVKDLSSQANPLAELFKQYETKLTQPATSIVRPGEKATEADWQAYHKAIGVPETPDGYAYEAPQVPEKLKEFYKQDDELLGAMRGAAQKAGLTPDGFKHLASAFDGYYMAELQKAVDAADQQIAKLETDFKTKYGERSNVVLQQWQQQAKMAPDWAAAILEGAPAPLKVAMAAWSDAVATKYIKEDRLDIGAMTGQEAMTPDSYGDAYAQAFAKVRQTQPGTAEHMKAKQDLAIVRTKGVQVFKTK